MIGQPQRLLGELLEFLDPAGPDKDGITRVIVRVWMGEPRGWEEYTNERYDELCRLLKVERT